jgi:hypothetical protein
MGEQLFKKPKVAAPLSKAPPRSGGTEVANPGVEDTLAEVNKALGRVEISHGAQTVSYDVAGKSVAYVREALGPLLNVPKEAQAVVNGQPVAPGTEENTILGANTTLEFIKASGVKG